MNKSKFSLITLLLLVCGSVVFGQRTSPAAAAMSFYRFDRSHSQVFVRRNIDVRKRWFSPELYALFAKELRRQAEFVKKNPDEKPYFGDGLPFQPYDETCIAGGHRFHKTLNLAPSSQQDDRASVAATFAFPKPCKDADPTVYTIRLIRGRGSWLIDDVDYGEDRHLKQDLSRKDY